MRLIRPLLVLLALAGAAWLPAAASEIELLPQDQARAAIGGLMQPISPFIAGDARSTTAIAQIGGANAAASSVRGTSSLSLIAQGGTGNRAIQAIQGNNSALLLAQGGQNNSVVQASRGDGNFQLVGVSGANNTIGYVQVGDGLAGALNVTDAQNSTVLTVQTPASQRFLMPVGLRGLRNAVVVIVPGRMHVFPNR